METQYPSCPGLCREFPLSSFHDCATPCLIHCDLIALPVSQRFWPFLLHRVFYLRSLSLSCHPLFPAGLCLNIGTHGQCSLLSHIRYSICLMYPHNTHLPYVVFFIWFWNCHYLHNQVVWRKGTRFHPQMCSSTSTTADTQEGRQ